ncbi:MAG: tRNA (adenosine(37)-N6)-threonylcarbamoyltransferase complex dimerization subunit type 1 TsaB [Pyrinomonadaceae bacterium]
MPLKDSALILTIETATRVGSLALARGSGVLGTRSGGDASVSHSQNLLPHIETLLAESSVTLGEIELFAAAAGPGSFTGLRIGLATIKAFAATLARPCLGVPTLYGIARAAGVSAATLAMLPAGRGEVFWQLLAVNEQRHIRALSAPGHARPQDLLNEMQGTRALIWAGEGARAFAELIEEGATRAGIAFEDEADDEAMLRVHKGGRAETQGGLWRMAKPVECLAEQLSALALTDYRGSAAPSRPEELQALYVRMSDAEISRLCQGENRHAK